MLRLLLILIHVQIAVNIRCYYCEFCDEVTAKTPICEGYFCLTLHLTETEVTLRYCTDNTDPKSACNIEIDSVDLGVNYTINAINETDCFVCDDDYCNRKRFGLAKEMHRTTANLPTSQTITFTTSLEDKYFVGNKSDPVLSEIIIVTVLLILYFSVQYCRSN